MKKLLQNKLSEKYTENAQLIKNKVKQKFSAPFSYAFTLAEVLITLGILGVLAAILIPSLNNKIQENVFKERWRKEYSSLNQAFNLVKADGDIDVDSYFNCNTTSCTVPLVQAIIAKYKNVKENTKTLNLFADIVPTYKSITGYQWPANSSMFLGEYDMNDITIFYWSWYSNGASIWIDVNGYRNKPNVVGKDLFAAELRGGRMFPMGAQINISGYNMSGDWCSGVGSTSDYYDAQAVDSNYYAGIGCSAKYIYGN